MDDVLDDRVELLPLAEWRVTPVGERGDNAAHVSC